MSDPVPYLWHAFAPSRFGLVLHQSSPGRASFLRASQVFAQCPEVSTVLDGPMFADPDVIRYLYFDRAAGIDVQGQSAYAARGATLSVVGGAVEWRRHRDVAPGADVAIQCPFGLVVDGHDVAPTSGTGITTQVWRGALGTLSDGSVLFAVGHGSVPAFTRHALAEDYEGGRTLRWLYYTDGGHSTLLRRRGQPGAGFPGEDPKIFGWLVERDGPATVMPAIGSTPPVRSSSSGSAHPTASSPPAAGGMRPAMARGSGLGWLAALGAVGGAVPVAKELKRRR